LRIPGTPAGSSIAGVFLRSYLVSNEVSNASSHAIAGGIIIVALMEFLVQKGILTNDEVRGILETAHKRIIPLVESNINAQSAAQIVDGLLAKRFRQK
jgi:hypothetical protein